MSRSTAPLNESQNGLKGTGIPMNLQWISNESLQRDLEQFYLSGSYDLYGKLLVPLLMEKLPPNMRLMISRAIDQPEWDFDVLLRTVNTKYKSFFARLGPRWRSRSLQRAIRIQSQTNIEIEEQSILTLYRTWGEKRWLSRSFKRFICRRGIPRLVVLDNAKILRTACGKILVIQFWAAGSVEFSSKPQGEVEI